jgi:DegV family protein with EDD domain
VTTAPSGRRVAVACESTACLPPELARRYGVAVVPVPFVFGSQTFLDGVDLEPEAFYARLAASPVPPKTSPPEPGAYLAAWEAVAADAEALVLVTVSGRISTFERSARLAQDLAAERLPRTRVVILDSGSAGMGQGFVALEAARAAAAGLDPDAVCARARAVAQRVDLVVVLDTLRYLARASRIPQVAALVGSLVDLKPIIRVVRGEVQPVARVRTRRRSLDQLAEIVERLAPAGAPLHLAVQHARAPAEAAWLLDRLRARRDCVEEYVTEFTPVMGAYCGPGLVGAAFYPDPAPAAGG